MAKRKAWSKVIEAHGVKVRLFERGGTIYRDVTLGRVVSENGRARTQHDIKSLGHSDRTRAEAEAAALCAALAEARLTGAHSGRLTLGQLFAAYRLHRFPTVSQTRVTEANSRMAMFLEAWGNGLNVADIDATRVQTYAAKRRALEVVPPAFRPDENGKRRRGWREPKRPRDGALDAEFRLLNVILNWACAHRTNGRPLLDRNPLPRDGKARRTMGWPVEKNPRRPVASHDRYTRTRDSADAIDPAGRLRAILALARYTARRESAICALHACDILLSPDRVRAALAEAGLNEADGEHMPNGAIRWREDSDKKGYLFITPLGGEARAEVDRYLRANPRMGDVPLFPAPGPLQSKKKPAPKKPPPEKPMRRDTALNWLMKAERQAGLPKLRGGGFHPYRRLWAIERRHLPAVDVAAAGGWGDTQALTRIYQRATAVGVLGAVNG